MKHSSIQYTIWESVIILQKLNLAESLSPSFNRMNEFRKSNTYTFRTIKGFGIKNELFGKGFWNCHYRINFSMESTTESYQR